MFARGFNGTVCPGDTLECEVDGYTVTATVYADDDATPPWKRDSSTGDVSEWTTRAKRPGERVLTEERSQKRYYDFAGTLARAKAEGWAEGTGTAAEKAARAVGSDFLRMRAWCRDEWRYVGIAVTVGYAGVDLTSDYGHALWGIESDCGDYCTEVACEIAEEAMAAARAERTRLAAVLSG